jgi:hypothetical protein
MAHWRTPGATLVGVVMAGCGAASLSGCAHSGGGSRAVENGLEYTVVVHNNASHAVEVTWTLAFQNEGTGETGQAMSRSLGTILPGGAGTDGPVMVMNPPPSYETYRRVTRVRVTIPAASWQEPAYMWWEIIGEMPRSFSIRDGRGPDGFMLVLTPELGRIEAVPRQYWPEQDQSPGAAGDTGR